VREGGRDVEAVGEAGNKAVGGCDSGGREGRKAVGTAVDVIDKVVGMAIEIEGEREGGMAGRIDVRMAGGIAEGWDGGLV
jgi:hypothetical protein